MVYFTHTHTELYTSNPHPYVEGLVFSFALIIGIIIAGAILYKFFRVRTEFIRKFVHIGVSNWWFILIRYFDSFHVSLIGPIFFIIINFITTKLDLLKYVGIREKSHSYGLVYFPISLVIIIILLEFDFINEMHAGIGILSMGYGDGLAAIAGILIGKHKLPFFAPKSYEGTIVMFCVTFFICVIFQYIYSYIRIPQTIIISFLTAFLEATVPFGLDNISVPIGSSIISKILL